MASNYDYTNEDVSMSLKRNWEPELPSEAEAEARSGPELEAAPSEELNGVKLWYPEADRGIGMHVRGTYANNYPVGAVVHFTAGRRERGDADAEQTMVDGRDNRYLYFCISSTGKVYQPASLNKWGSHCGVSSFPGLGESLGNKLTGIEVCAAGLLKQTDRGFEPWWNDLYPANSPKRTVYTEAEVRFTRKVENVTAAGHYLKFTPAQESSLISLLLWLHENNPAVFKIKNILGHDEISPNRKNDPGAAMSMYMSPLRAHIAELASMPPSA